MRRALLVVVAALCCPAPAFAHATLLKTWPSFRERLASSPPIVRLHFDQAVKAVPGSVQLLDADVRSLPVGPGRLAHGGYDLFARLPRLAKGPYTIRWRAVSGDGHVVSGVFTFGVRYPAPLVTDAAGASGPTRTEHVVRWLYFLALALLVGGLGFRLVAARGPLPPRAEKRFFVLTGIGAIATLEVGIVAFLLRCEDALQLPFGRLLYGDLSPMSAGTRFGQAFIAMTLGYALATAFLFLAWLTDRRVLLWPAFVIGLGFASGLSLSGHSAADAGASWLSELADWVHLAAATLWVGGLVQLFAVVWPLAPELRREAFLRFSRLATVLVGLLLVAGTYLSILRLPHVRDLWTTGYGHVLLVKLSLVCIALLWGALHHFVARPLLERGETGVLARLPRSLVGESAVAMAILLAAAVLVDSKPPAQPPPAPAVATASR